MNKETETSSKTETGNDFLAGVGRSASRPVTYLHSQAFTECDCGKEITLSQTIYGDPTYYGFCECGLKFKLRNNKIWTENETA